MTTEPAPVEPDNPAAYALARHIADHPVSTIQAAFRYLNAPLGIELHAESDDTDLTESAIDRMMAAGVPAQIVTAPPDTYAPGRIRVSRGDAEAFYEPDEDSTSLRVRFETAEKGVTAPPAPAVPAGRDALRDRIAEALERADYRPDMRRGDLADAIMPVLWGLTLRELELLHRPNTTPSRPEPRPTPAEEAYRLALSTALRLGTGANWEAIRDRAEDLVAEVGQLTEASRRLLEQRQEMAAERFTWQERGDRAEARVRQLEAAPHADRAAVLRELEERYRGNACDSVHPDFRAAYAAVANDLRRLADEERDEREAQAHLDQLADELPSMADEAQQPEPGPYRHYKGGAYTVIATGRHTETGEQLVIYRAGDDWWCRPAASFASSVEAGGQVVPRFTPVAEAEQQTETPACPDPIECGHEAALGQARQEVMRVREVCDRLRRVSVLADGEPHTDRERGVIQAVTRVLAALDAQPAVVAAVAGEEPDTETRKVRQCPARDIVYGRCIRPVHLNDDECFHAEQPIRIDEETDGDTLCGSEYPGDDNFVGQLCGLPKEHFGAHRCDEPISAGYTAKLRWAAVSQPPEGA